MARKQSQLSVQVENWKFHKPTEELLTVKEIIAANQIPDPGVGVPEPMSNVKRTNLLQFFNMSPEDYRDQMFQRKIQEQQELIVRREGVPKTQFQCTSMLGLTYLIILLYFTGIGSLDCRLLTHNDVLDRLDRARKKNNDLWMTERSLLTKTAEDE